MSVSPSFYRKNLCCYRLSLLLGVRLRIGKLSGGISRNSEGGGGGGEIEEPKDLGYSWYS